MSDTTKPTLPANVHVLVPAGITDAEKTMAQVAIMELDRHGASFADILRAANENTPAEDAEFEAYARRNNGVVVKAARVKAWMRHLLLEVDRPVVPPHASDCAIWVEEACDCKTGQDPERVS